MKKIILCSVLLWTMGTLSLSAQTRSDAARNTQLIENELQQILEDNKGVGLSVALVKDGKLHYHKAFGLKNRESGETLEQDDLFRIASISKSFAATAIMQLVEKGLFSLDDDFGDLVGFPIRNPKFPDQKITLRMVLSHTSSINDSEGYFQLKVIHPDSNANWAKSYSDYAPGSDYRYCNLNYNMVGAVIERFTNQRYDQYIIQNILTPLGLYGGYSPSELEGDRFATLYTYNTENQTYSASPAAYHPRLDELRNYTLGWSTPVLSPTGGLKISAVDLAKYMIMHMNYGAKDGVRIISERSAKEMQTPVSAAPSNYGLALNVKDNFIPGKTMVGHTGSAYGLYSQMYFQPEEKFGFVIITNGFDHKSTDGYTKILIEAARALHKHFLE